MPCFCAVASCDQKYIHSEDVSYHKFPLKSPPHVLSEWIKFTGRGPDWKPSRWSAICSRHFDTVDYRDYLARKCLMRNAIPTVKDKISYETYHITTYPTEIQTKEEDVEDIQTCDLSTISESIETTGRKSFSDVSCRLCGERDENTTNSNMGSLDDYEIDAMLRKCLPSLGIQSDCDRLRVVCTECISQLKQFSNFIDRIHSYQKDLNHNESYDKTEIRIVPTKTSISSAITSTIYIKQEPVNVKQEKVDTSNRKVASTSNSVAKAANEQTNTNIGESPPAYAGNQCCDKTFDNNFDPSNHKCSAEQSVNDQEQTNNCEIMEVITLNNPVSFIDLAEDDAGIVEMTNLKTEHFFECDHSYAKRPFYNFKQEITGTGYEDHERATSNAMSFDEDYGTPTLEKDCQQPSKSKILLDAHVVDMNTPKKKKCPLCCKSFESVYDYLKHKNKRHRVTCFKCKRKYPSIILKNHERVCLRRSQVPFTSCEQCAKYIPNYQMQKHLENCNKKEKIIECPVDVTAVPQISTESQMENINPKFLCSFCYRTFTRVKHFDEHVKIHIKYNHKKYPMSVLSEEASKFAHKMAASDSLQNETILDAVTQNMNPPGNESLTCQTCDKHFSSLAKVKQHKATHDEEKKFACVLCPKKFKGMSGLKQHIDSFHYKIRPYICPVCFYSFALKGDMLRCRHRYATLSSSHVHDSRK